MLRASARLVGFAPFVRRISSQPSQASTGIQSGSFTTGGETGADRAPLFGEDEVFEEDWLFLAIRVSVGRVLASSATGVAVTGVPLTPVPLTGLGSHKIGWTV